MNIIDMENNIIEVHHQCDNNPYEIVKDVHDCKGDAANFDHCEDSVSIIAVGLVQKYHAVEEEYNPE